MKNQITKLPKITVVTPVYNGEKYIEKTINSVLSQNYPNLEYIIIDGGSTDNTVKIIKKYSKKLAFWVSEKDDGIYSAIQKGFDISTGDIMAWINADDYYSPYCFSTIADIFTTFKEVQWLTGLTVTYDESDRIVNATNSYPFSRIDLLSGNYQWIQQESTFWTRKLWNKSGKKLANYSLASDFELWLRFSRYASLYTVNTYLGGFRQRSKDQLSLEGMKKYIAECNEIIENEPKNNDEIKLIKKIKNLTLLKKILIKLKFFNYNFIQTKIQKICNINQRVIQFNRTKQEYFI